MFCPSGGCDICGFEIDIPPGIYPPGLIDFPPGFTGPFPTVTVHRDGTPEYSSSESQCESSKTATDITYYVSYELDPAGKTTKTDTTSTASHITVGCDVTATTTTEVDSGQATGTASEPASKTSASRPSTVSATATASRTSTASSAMTSGTTSGCGLTSYTFSLPQGTDYTTLGDGNATETGTITGTSSGTGRTTATETGSGSSTASNSTSAATTSGCGLTSYTFSLPQGTDYTTLGEGNATDTGTITGTSPGTGRTTATKTGSGSSTASNSTSATTASGCGLTSYTFSLPQGTDYTTLGEGNATETGTQLPTASGQTATGNTGQSSSSVPPSRVPTQPPTKTTSTPTTPTTTVTESLICQDSGEVKFQTSDVKSHLSEYCSHFAGVKYPAYTDTPSALKEYYDLGSDNQLELWSNIRPSDTACPVGQVTFSEQDCAAAMDDAMKKCSDGSGQTTGGNAEPYNCANFGFIANEKPPPSSTPPPAPSSTPPPPPPPPPAGPKYGVFLALFIYTDGGGYPTTDDSFRWWTGANGGQDAPNYCKDKAIYNSGTLNGLPTLNEGLPPWDISFTDPAADGRKCTWHTPGNSGWGTLSCDGAGPQSVDCAGPPSADLLNCGGENPRVNPILQCLWQDP